MRALSLACALTQLRNSAVAIAGVQRSCNLRRANTQIGSAVRRWRRNSVAADVAGSLAEFEAVAICATRTARLSNLSLDFCPAA